MRKLTLSIGLVIIAVTSTLAQNTKPVPQQSLWKAGLLFPSLEYEAKLKQNVTLKSRIGLSAAFGYGGNQVGWLFDYGLYVELSPRYYYNFDERLEDGKTIKKYSANYLSFVSVAYLNKVLSSTEDPNRYVFGPAWGLQRNLGKGWYFNFEAGPGISLSKQETYVVPVIGLDIGFQL